MDFQCRQLRVGREVQIERPFVAVATRIVHHECRERLRQRVHVLQSADVGAGRVGWDGRVRLEGARVWWLSRRREATANGPRVQHKEGIGDGDVGERGKVYG